MFFVFFLPLVFHKEFHERMKTPFYRLQIFKFEKWVKYANEMADDVIHSTQCFIEYINRVILANLQRKTFKLGRKHTYDYTNSLARLLSDSLLLENLLSDGLLSDSSMPITFKVVV